MHYALPLRRLRCPGHYVRTLPILAALLISMFCPPVVQAAGGEAQFGLKPVFYDPSDPVTASYFIFNARPGSIIHSEVRVINSGTAAGAVSLYAVDATTGQTSGTVFLSRQAPRQDVGAWVTLGTQQLTLAPGQSQIVRIPLKLDTFLPQTTIDYPVFITGRALGVGHYQAILTMSYGNHHTLSYTAAFAIAPAQIAQVFHQPPPLAPPALSSSGNLILWQVVAGVLIVMLVILGALYWRSHGWRKVRRSH
jgi:hypothetical protein